VEIHEVGVQDIDAQSGVTTQHRGVPGLQAPEDQIEVAAVVEHPRRPRREYEIAQREIVGADVAGALLQLKFHRTEILEKFEAEARAALGVHDAPKDALPGVVPRGEVPVGTGAGDKG